MVNKETLQRKMLGLQEPSTLPVIVQRLLEVFENPQLSLNDIAVHVSKDPALTTRLLQVVNSPFFGFTGRISSVTQALLLLGLSQARGLLLGIHVSELMKGAEELWAHSVATGVLAQITGRKKGVQRAEELFVTGLLHDIGMVFLSLKFPNEYRNAFTLAQDRNVPISDVEKDLFESTHAEVAGWVLDRWSLPRQFIPPIRYHHEPALANEWLAETAVLHFSDVLAWALGFGAGGDAIVPEIDETAWDHLSLSKAEIKAILWESEPRIREAQSLLVC